MLNRGRLVDLRELDREPGARGKTVGGERGAGEQSIRTSCGAKATDCHVRSDRWKKKALREFLRAAKRGERKRKTGGESDRSLYLALTRTAYAQRS